MTLVSINVNGEEIHVGMENSFKRTIVLWWEQTNQWVI